jgi:hypothetical protein
MISAAVLSQALDELRAIARSEDTLAELDQELDDYLAGNPAAEYMKGEPA